MKDSNQKNTFTVLLFIIYLLSLYWILIFKLGIRFSNMGNTRNINLIPFAQPTILNGKVDLGEMILNVIIFVPLGIYAGMLFKRWNFGKKLLLFFGVSFVIEMLQYIMAVGASDITDIVTNTFGGIIGLLMYMGIEKAFGNRARAQKFINVLAAISTAFMISLLLYLKINKLLMFRMG